MTRLEAKRAKEQRAYNRAATVAVSVVVMCLALAAGVKVNSLRRKQAVYEERVRVLNEQVQAEEERAEALEQYRIYITTKEYIEKTAKEKLGLVNPDEILLKPEQ